MSHETASLVSGHHLCQTFFFQLPHYNLHPQKELYTLRVELSVIRLLGYRHKNQKVNNGNTEAASHRSLSYYRLVVLYINVTPADN